MPEENKTKIGVRADMTIDDEPVAVEGLLGGDFFLQLNKPASLGTPISFSYWLRDTYKVENLDIMLPYDTAAEFKAAYKTYKKAPKPLEAAIDKRLNDKGIPPQLHTLMKSAFLAELTITDLLIDIKAADDAKKIPEKKKMMFGLSVGFTKALELLPNIEVNKLSILIMNAPSDDFTFPKRVELPRSTPLPIEAAHATGSIAFSGVPEDKGAITLGKDVWTFVAGGASAQEVAISDSLEGTLTSLAAALNAASAVDTAKCKYVASADGKRLEITYKLVGVSGNDFIIEADAKSKGSPSGPTLKGGLDDDDAQIAEGAAASGSITFSAIPQDDSKITLNGTDWTFDKDNKGVTKSKIGKDVPDTVKLLAEGLSASKDKEIAKSTYEASDSALVITFKEKGSVGNTFKIAADKESKGKPSDTTLSGGS